MLLEIYETEEIDFPKIIHILRARNDGAAT
jgi:hypothetical protein